MGKHTGISWTDHTFNPWWGCTKVSPGCDNCYAETFDKRVGGNHWGKGQPRRTFSDKHWNEPLKWNRDALAKLGRPARVFCASMADVMDDEAPAGARERLWALIDATPNLRWQLLTKRPQRYTKYLPKEFEHKNVQLGFTAEDQPNFNLRFHYVVDAALNYDGMTIWVSYEPVLGPLTLEGYHLFPDWIIVGGESGNGRREFKREWADSLLTECRESGVRFFMKQMGGRTPDEGKRAIPPELLIQEFPA